jgi:2-dehydropantoate 2-reductase
MTSSSPRIAIFGAGAIGVYLAARLAAAKVPVTLIAREQASTQIATTGLFVDEGPEGGQLHIESGNPFLRPATAVSAWQAGEQFDIFIITTKSHQIVPALSEIAPLLAPGALIVCLQNGIPWWYFQGLSEQNLRCLDPDNIIPGVLPPRQVVGGVIHKAAELTAPGQVTACHAADDRFIFGSPFANHSPEGLATLISAFQCAGIATHLSSDIRRDVWEKLLGNAVLNPLSALTNARSGDIIRFTPTRIIASVGMQEAIAVARAYGITLAISPDTRLERARVVGTSRTSMLQDKLRGKPLETDGILGGLLELAQRAGIPAPHLETLYAAVALLSQNLNPA